MRLHKGINWYLLSLGYLGIFAYGFIDNSRGPVFPDILKTFSLNDSIGSLFFLVASTAALINNVVLFKWIERIGAFRTTQVYSISQVLGLLIIGLAHDYVTTLVGAVFVGAAFGGMGVSVNLLVPESVDPAVPTSIRRQALSGLHALYGVSSLLAPLVITILYKLGFTWQGSLGWLATGPALVLLLSFFGKPPANAHVEQNKNTPRGPRANRVAIFFTIISTAYVVAEISLGTRLALYARRDWNFTVESANALVSLFYVGLFAGRLMFSLFRFPMENRRVLTLSASLGFVCYALGLLVHPAWLALAGLGLSVFYPCMIALINDEQGPWAGFVISWSITLQSIGLMAMHFLLGGLSDAFGLRSALWIGPIALAVVLICLGGKARFAPLYVRENAN